MFGIVFRGHPFLRRILLDEDWPGPPAAQGLRGHAPRRRQAALLSDGTDARRAPAPAAADAAPVYEDYFVNMGPQHPSTHGVLRLVLKLAGETVLGLTPLLGYVHRGIEKMGEAMTVAAVHAPHRPPRLPLGAHEQLGLGARGGAGPRHRGPGARRAHPRDHVRAHAHLLAPALVGRARHGPRRVHPVPLRLPRPRAGQRHLREDLRRAPDDELHPPRRRDGQDVEENFAKDVRAFLDYFTPVIDEYETLRRRQHHLPGAHEGDRRAQRRAGALARLHRPDAAGQRRRLRRAQATAPTGSTRSSRSTSPVATEGDSWARYKVRIDEMRESLKIIRQALDTMPGGPGAGQAPARSSRCRPGRWLGARRGRPRRDRLLPGRRRHRQALARSRCAARTSRTWRRCPRSSRAAAWPTWWPCSPRSTSSSPASTGEAHDRPLALAHRDDLRRP